MASLQKVVGIARPELMKKRGVIAETCVGHGQRPMARFKLEIRASLKKPSGKMEFSRCKTLGSSPSSRRAASARRDARFSANPGIRG